MTEQEWRECDQPHLMLKMIEGAGAAPDCKLRILACLCARRMVTPDAPTWLPPVLDACERFAEGLIELSELQAAAKKLIVPYLLATDSVERARPLLVASEALDWHILGARHAEANLRFDLGEGIIWRPAVEAVVLDPREQSGRCDLIRELFRNPSEPTWIDPAVLAWNDGTVRRIAEGIDDRRAFGSLPILADALLDAGCDDEELIQHCRSDGPHFRGCWAVDAVLGRS